MPKCQNCGRWTSITYDLICPHCGQPIADKGQIKILKKRKQALDDAERITSSLSQIGQERIRPPRIEREVLKIGFLGLVYLLVFADIEFISAYLSRPSGIIFSCIILLFLIINASPVPARAHREFFLALNYGGSLVV